MRKCSEWLKWALLCIVSLMAGCGGGGGSDAVCSNFRYQEDAQAAYAAGARQLDGDGDGVACESLPRRPTSGGGGTGGATTLPPYNLFTAQGTIGILRPAFGAYSLYYEGGGAGGPLPVTNVGGASQVESSGITVRFAGASDGSLVAWTPSRGSTSASPGVGAAAADAASIAELIGSYRLLGQRCTPSTGTCSALAASARISAGGTVELCLNVEFSTSCAGVVRQTLTEWRSVVGAAGNVWSLGGGSSFLVGSRARRTVALAYGTTDRIILFGHRDDVTSAVPLNSRMLGFDLSGTVRNEVPSAAQWAVQAQRPLQGFYGDAVGNAYLRSSTGQLVTWSVVEGLRLYSTP